MSKPIAIQRKDKEDKYLENYKMLQEAGEEPYHYASLYSNSGTVLHYLVRLPPFTKMFLDYQGNFSPKLIKNSKTKILQCFIF